MMVTKDASHTESLKKRKQELEKAIESTREKKKEILDIVSVLENQRFSGKISKQQYDEELKRKLDNRSAEQWMKYYDDFISYYNHQVDLCDKLIKKEEIEFVRSVRIRVIGLLILVVLIGLFISISSMFGSLVFKNLGITAEKVSIMELVKLDKIKSIFTGDEEPSESRGVLENELTIPGVYSEKPDVAKLSKKTEDLGKVETTHLQPILGKPVKWISKVTTNSGEGRVTVELPQDSENIKIIGGREVSLKKKGIFNKRLEIELEDSNGSKITYETTAPRITEEEIDGNKKIIVIEGNPDEDIHYKNVLVNVRLPRPLELESINRIRLKDENLQQQTFSPIDEDEDGLIEGIEFLTDLSSVTYSIEITGAEHLDSGKVFISDIYDEVKARDDVWSESIINGEYVRVTYEQELDSTKDITVYARSLVDGGYGYSLIEVYDFDLQQKIGEFNVGGEGEYKFLLSDFDGISDTFELKITGEIEFDYISDPADFEADVIFEGVYTGGQLGTSVAGGDFNGDGIEDVLVGARGGGGKAYIYFGRKTGTFYDNEADVIFDSSSNPSNFGGSVAMGDFNGDGIDDALIGAMVDHSKGRAYIFIGGQTGTIDYSSANVIFEGTSSSTQPYFGGSVAMGDFNGDGIDDALIGAYNEDLEGTGRGRAYIFFGGQTGTILDSNADVIFSGSFDTTNLGCEVTMGDLNGDGIDDALIGAYGDDNGGSNEGKAYLFYGGQIGSIDDVSADVIFDGTMNYAFFGSSIFVGDFNGDLKNDVLISSPQYYDGVTSQGRVFLFFGEFSSTVSDSEADVIFDGTGAEYSYFGDPVAMGDFNNDRKDDVLIGAYGEDSYEGKAYLFYGGQTGFFDDTSADVIFDGTATSARFGSSVAMSDFNDGIDDVIIGAPTENSGLGKAYIFFDPIIGISTCQELQEIGDFSHPEKPLSGSYVLLNDIDCNGNLIEPIGILSDPFTGIFDGKGFKVFNFQMGSDLDSYQGLFGYVVNADIRSMGVESADINGKNYVGGLIGKMVGGIVTDSYSNANILVASSGISIGGLVGWNEGTIDSSYSSGNVDSADSYESGGLVGYNDGIIINSYATGDVYAENGQFIGGLVGHVFENGVVTNSYATGDIYGDYSVGGLIGRSYYGTITNSYSIGSVSGNSYVGGFAGEFEGSLVNSYWYDNSGNPSTCIGTGSNPGCTAETDNTKFYDYNGDGEGDHDHPVYDQADNYNDWEFGDTETAIWVGSSCDYPILSWQTSGIPICNCEELQGIGTTTGTLHDNYILVKDIDCSATKDGTSIWDASGFQPIGDSYGYPFTGVLDGNRHEIKNLYINRVGVDYVGLFGYVDSGGKILNIGLKDIDISGGSYVGGLMGYGNDILIRDSFSSGNINGYAYTGGVVGQMGGSSVLNGSYSEVNIETDLVGGGLVGGIIEGDSVVENCYFKGNVDCVSINIYDNTICGGLIGYHFDISGITSLHLTNSYSTGDVSSYGDIVGGLIGSSQCYLNQITNSYSTGSIYCIGDKCLLGDNVGGLIGYDYQIISNLNNLYWYDNPDDDADNCIGYIQSESGPSDCSGVSGTNGLETDSTLFYDYNGDGEGDHDHPVYDRADNYDDWEFGDTETAIWKDIEGSYPIFVWQVLPGIPIGSCEGLQEIGDPAYPEKPLDGDYYLVNDIDCSMTNPSDPSWDPVGLWSDQLGFDPIGSSIVGEHFTGNFDGNKNRIKGLYVYRNQDYIGLFSYIENANIGNLSLENLNITGKNDVGGLVGFFSRSYVSEVSTTGTVRGSYVVGGLVGEEQYGTIINTYSKADVYGTIQSVGGLVGSTTGGISTAVKIINSYATGKVTGGSSVGGIVGDHDSYSNTGNGIENSFATGEIYGSSSLGGAIGSDGGTFDNVWWADNPNDQATVCWGWSGSPDNCYMAASKEDFFIKSHQVYDSLDVLDDWEFGDTDPAIWKEVECGYPIFEWQAILGIPICSCEGLQEIGDPAYPEKPLDGDYYLVNDIDCSATKDGTSIWDTGGFNPIGSLSEPFIGSLDGNGYKISNLFINKNQDYVGLFGFVGSVGVVENVSLKDFEITDGTQYIGGLVGYNEGDIENLNISGILSISGFPNIGGLVGYNAGNLRFTSASIDIVSRGSTGGLVGRNIGNIYNSSSRGIIRGEEGYGIQYAGGLVGYFSSGKINNSYSNVDIDTYGYGQYHGGLVGYSHSSITNCYATGNVNGGGQVGGLVGYVEVGGTITDCYATGSSVGSTQVGGLVGNNRGIVKNSYSTGSVEGFTSIGGLAGVTATNIINSYWYNNSENPDVCVGQILSGSVDCEGETDNSVFFIKTHPVYDQSDINDDWEFGDTDPAIWKEVECSYPIFVWQDVPGILICTCEELQEIGDPAYPEKPLDGSYIMLQDIDCSGVSNFDPIGDCGDDGYCGGGWSADDNPFSGIFNGTGHIIKNVNMDYPSWKAVGLFPYVLDGEITKVGLENINVVGLGYVNAYCGVGGMVGTLQNSYIHEVYSTGDVESNINVGGLVGYSIYSNIIDAYSNANVFVNSDTGGGFAGRIVYGTVKNSYATGDVSGSSKLGGFAGEMDNGDSNSFENCYATGKILGSGYGIVGSFDAASRNIWWYNDPGDSVELCGPSSGDQVDCHIVSGEDELYYKTQDVYDSNDPNWDFINVWKELDDEGIKFGYPIFIWQKIPEPPEILDIEPPTAPTLTEDDGTGTITTSVPFSFIAWDPRGVDKLPDTGSIVAEGYYERTSNTPYGYNTQRTFTQASCTSGASNIDATAYGKPAGTFAKRYTCDVSMYYYDDSLPWDIYITSFQDLANAEASNLPFSEVGAFSPSETTGFYTSENDLDFGTVGTSITAGVSSASPVVVKNTGNANFDGATAGKIFNWKGRDLTGHDNPSKIISAENFDAHLDDPSPATCENAVTKVTLSDKVEVPAGDNFPAMTLPNGDHTSGTDAKTTVYFCLTALDPGLSVQSYSTTPSGTNDPWVLSNV